MTTTTAVVKRYEAAVKQAQTDYEKKVAERTCDAVRAVLEVIPMAAEKVEHYGDLNKPEIIKVIRLKAAEVISERAKVATPLLPSRRPKNKSSSLTK